MKATMCELEDGMAEPQMAKTVLEEKEDISKLVFERGLSSAQAKIYLTLTRKGPMAFESISERLKIERADVCRAVLRLQKLGFVYVGECPLRVYGLKNHLIAH